MSSQILTAHVVSLERRRSGYRFEEAFDGEDAVELRAFDTGYVESRSESTARRAIEGKEGLGDLVEVKTTQLI